MGETEFQKFDIAKAQLETALRLYFEKSDYFSVITLAGAAEEILGMEIKRRGRENALDTAKKLTSALSRVVFGKPTAPKAVAIVANRARNAMKHMDPGGRAQSLWIPLKKPRQCSIVQYSTTSGSPKIRLIACFGSYGADDRMVKKISKLAVTMSSLLDAVSESVKAWEPVDAARETQYSAALATYLREASPPDARVETEYRDGGTTTDVWLSWQGLVLSGQVFIEVKRNLEKKTDYDRLVGQITGLKPGDRRVLVVLVGETNRELVGRLREQFRDDLDEEQERLRIVLVKPLPP